MTQKFFKYIVNVQKSWNLDLTQRDYDFATFAAGSSLTLAMRWNLDLTQRDYDGAGSYLVILFSHSFAGWNLDLTQRDYDTRA